MPLPGPGRTLRVIGFDDVPWRHRRGGEVGLVGVVCATTRFEGMVYGAVRRDGWRATLTIETLLTKSKFLPQIHLVLLDGIAFGGFNVVDLPRLARTLRRPCVAVMRKLPDLPAMERAAHRLPRPGARLAVLRRAGPIHVGGHRGEAQALASAYRSAFDLAIGHGLRSIAFPAISTGAYGYPIEEATQIAIREARRHEDALHIVFCCFSARDAGIYRHYLGRI